MEYKRGGQPLADLGFGLMRLPRRADGSMDIDEISRMADAFLAAGYKHFDTAYMYDDGASEEAFGACVAARYPREAFTVTSKLVAWRACADEQSAKQELEISLRRMGISYLDEYLMHAIRQDNYLKYDEYHIWDYMEELLAKGLIKRYGFSYHAGPELLDELLTKHPGVSTVQLQINYADWNSLEVQAKKNVEVARRHGVSVTAFSPLRSGALSQPKEAVGSILQKDYVSFALRFAGSLEGVDRVLTGASTLSQMQSTLASYQDREILNEQEQATVAQAMAAYQTMEHIDCDSCHRCSDVCPKLVSIPEIFNAMNEVLLFDLRESAQALYGRITTGRGRGRAKDCVGCGKCEDMCPQKISIVDWLGRCRAQFDQ